jgi:uncharacterized protein YeaO (DUF488 family)
MKRYSFLLILFLFIVRISLADEGMWLLPLIQKLNIKRMNEMGFHLSAEDIYSINRSSLKDAVVALDGGQCTAEMISEEGLLLTNHHCGYENIQEHSSIEHDYLTNGFWAMSRNEELPNPNKSATFLISMQDVTDKINTELYATMTEEERDAKIKEISSRLESEASDSILFLDAQIESFFSGTQFYLIITQTFKDVRLVGAPPSSIGKFGGETDNWIWPRHTGDFSIFRVYCSPDGKPAEYSAKNVPLHPKHYLPISLRGVKEGDFSMIMGYPGNTNRYITSFGIKELVNETNPNRVKIRGLKQDIWQHDMAESDKIRIQYSAKFAESSNYYKYSIGQQKFIKQLGLIEKREQLEKQFFDWASADPGRKSKYGDVLNMLHDSYMAKQSYEHVTEYIQEAFLEGIDILSMGLTLNSSMALDKKGELHIDAAKIRKFADNYFKDLSIETSKKEAVAMLDIFRKNVPLEFQPDIYKLIQLKYKGDYKKYIDKIYSKTMLTDRSRLEDFIAKPSLKRLWRDPGIQFFGILVQKYLSEIQPLKDKLDVNITKGSRAYIMGLMEMLGDKSFYPDANSTMRMSYGTVGSYKPADAVKYDYYTTLKGVMEKEDPINPEFVVPEKLKELYRNNDYGRYANDGSLSLCFITNNDISGGNSGSPVINANGELVGIAFDSNWEGMSSDLAYNEHLQKTICVDIRYVLFVIDKVAGAKNLLDELKIVQ